MTQNERLSEIQRQLNVPKSQYNAHGNYYYRNAEDILDAVKKLLRVGETIRCEDEIVLVGDRYYVKATACFSTADKSVCNTAYAREAEERKGMDASQITGATSSYARKYALNGLFAIDDVKDADSSDNTTSKPVAKPVAKPVGDAISFGKFQGTKWSEIPSDYLLWLISNEKTTPDVRAKAQEVISAKTAQEQKEPEDEVINPDDIPF